MLRTKMFTPKIGNSSLKTSKQARKPTSATSSVQPSIQVKRLMTTYIFVTINSNLSFTIKHREYPVDSPPPTQLKESVSLVDKPAAITRIRYSGLLYVF